MIMKLVMQGLTLRQALLSGTTKFSVRTTDNFVLNGELVPNCDKTVVGQLAKNLMSSPENMPRKAADLHVALVYGSA